jgi:DNA-binding protein HU-beta
MLEGITESLASGHKVTLTGFGVFEVKASKARMGRNPKTGEEIEIAAKNTPKFRPGKTLKEAVNG